MRPLLHIFFLLFYFNSYAGKYLKVMYIADHQIPCGSSKLCLLSRSSSEDEWKPFEATIEKFTYESGYEYCLLVEVQSYTSNPPIPFDTIRLKYVLSEIKYKIKTKGANDTLPVSYIPDSSRWMLYKLKTKDGTKTFSISKAWLQFGLPNEIMSGNTGCNTFDAVFTIDTTRLEFLNIKLTKLSCGKHSIEPDFINALNQADHYKITPNLLYLFREKFLLALFTKKK
jgi:heat shock protein HslJ